MLDWWTVTASFTREWTLGDWICTGKADVLYTVTDLVAAAKWTNEMMVIKAKQLLIYSPARYNIL